MRLGSVVVGPLGTNCYILTEDGKNCVVVDPGDEPDAILSVTTTTPVRSRN